MFYESTLFNFCDEKYNIFANKWQNTKYIYLEEHHKASLLIFDTL